MKGTLNPFEPWRPVADGLPRPLHVSRPWRPPAPLPVRAAVEEPLRVEAPPAPRHKSPERPKRHLGRTKEPSSRRTPISQLAAFVVLGLIGILIFDNMGWLCGTHAPRLLALGASAGLFAGMAFNRRRRWSTRLSWMTASLAFAGGALWVVPTLHGINLWSAYRQIEKLRASPSADVSTYQRGVAARRTLVEDFPSFAADVKAAEQVWLRRTVEEAIENADRQLTRDPDAALAQLHQLDKELAQLEHYASMRKDLESARRRAVQACVKVVQQP